MSKGTCRTCGAPIIWAPVVNTGALMPLDVQTELAPSKGLVAYNESTGCARVLSFADVREAQRFADIGVTFHKSHFATCPTAAEWRVPARRT